MSVLSRNVERESNRIGSLDNYIKPCHPTINIKNPDIKATALLSFLSLFLHFSHLTPSSTKQFYFHDIILVEGINWYAILRLTPQQGRESELVASQYRSLAIVLNPQKNKFPFSDQAFRLVVDAWSIRNGSLTP